MKSTIIGYGAALALALTGAYWSWTHEGELDPSKATVIANIDRDDLASIEFESPTARLRLEMREDELGPYVWGIFTPKGDAPKEPDEDGAPHEPRKPKAQREPQAFKVGLPGEGLVAAMAPFVAKRILEGVEDRDAADLGFGDEGATLALERAGREAKVYQVGTTAHGAKNRLVRDPEDGTIYVVAATLISQLETGALTLPDRSLHGFEIPNIDSVTVRGGEAEVTYVQNNPDDRAARSWSVQGSADKSLAAAGWFDKALNLRVDRYIDDAQRPPGLEEAFSMVVAAGRKGTEIVFFRTFSDDGETRWFASSRHNRALVELKSAAVSEVQADLASVLDAGA